MKKVAKVWGIFPDDLPCNHSDVLGHCTAETSRTDNKTRLLNQEASPKKRVNFEFVMEIEVGKDSG